MMVFWGVEVRTRGIALSCHLPTYLERRAAVQLAAALLSLVTVSCSTPRNAHGDPMNPQTPPGRDVSRQEKHLLYTAEQILQRRCMQRYGFQFWITPENPLPEDREFPYVVDDVPWARRHGYGSDLRRRVNELRRSNPNQRYLRTLSPQRRAAAITALDGDRNKVLEVQLPTGAVMGRSERGCSAEAERRLYGDLGTWFHAKAITADLLAIRRARVLGDPAFAAAVRRWSACMTGHGYAFASPDATRSAFPDPQTAAVRTREIRLAVAEATCAGSSGLADTARHLDRRYEKALNKQYWPVVTTRLHLELAAVPRARSVLATPEGSTS